MNRLLTITLFVALFAAACADDVPGKREVVPYGSTPDASVPDIYNPNEQGNGCEYGSGGSGSQQSGSGSGGTYGGCGPAISCDEDPCVRGTCTAGGEGDYCACESGYAGLLCDTCADGFTEIGLVCVSASACEGFVCGEGQCELTESGPSCTCDTGYAGEQCDDCAEGYVDIGGVCEAE